MAGNDAATSLGDGGPATSASLAFPQGVFGDGAGNIFIADTGNSLIREVVKATGNIQTVAGGGASPSTCAGSTDAIGDGCLATSASLQFPSGVFGDGAGNIFIADTGNSLIREVVKATGNMQTVAGNGTLDFCCDGGPATSAQENVEQIFRAFFTSKSQGTSFEVWGNIIHSNSFFCLNFALCVPQPISSYCRILSQFGATDLVVFQQISEDLV